MLAFFLLVRQQGVTYECGKGHCSAYLFKHQARKLRRHVLPSNNQVTPSHTCRSQLTSDDVVKHHTHVTGAKYGAYDSQRAPGLHQVDLLCG